MEQSPNVYQGHLCNNFYVKFALSADGKHLASASKCSNVFVWSVHPEIGGFTYSCPLALEGGRGQKHMADTTTVSWDPSEPGRLASTSDDCSVLLWDLDDAGSKFGDGQKRANGSGGDPMSVVA